MGFYTSSCRVFLARVFDLLSSVFVCFLIIFKNLLCGGRRWEAFFGMGDGDDMSHSDSSSSSETSADKMSMRSANAKPAGGGDGDDPKTEARSNKKVSCLKPKRPVVMPSDG